MIIKKATRKTCSQCGDTKVTQPEEVGCDYCKAPMPHGESLRVSVFFDGKETEQLDFCSWACVLKKLKTIKTDYFITLPFLQVDRPDRASVKGFWKAIKEIK